MRSEIEGSGLIEIALNRNSNKTFIDVRILSGPNIVLVTVTQKLRF